MAGLLQSYRRSCRFAGAVLLLVLLVQLAETFQWFGLGR